MELFVIFFFFVWNEIKIITKDKYVDSVNNRTVALKKLRLEKGLSGKEGLPITSIREIKLLKSIDHKNIINLLDIAVGKKLDSIYLVFDYVANDLAELNKNITGTFALNEIKCILAQFFAAVNYLHENWIIHRDLKLSNILYDNGEIKLCDFGLARYSGTPIIPLTPKVVTRYYRAPEILLGAKKYDNSIDIWACGCIMGELFTKEALFKSKSDFDQLEKMFDLLGFPKEKNWPQFKTLPFFDKFTFTHKG